MKNVTVTLPEEVARWARIEAAKRGTSVSRMLGEMLRAKMEAELAYGRSLRSFGSVVPRPLRKDGESLPTREELHDRAGIR